MITTNLRGIHRVLRHQRIRKKVKGTVEKPRLSVFRSSKNLYVQLIDDLSGKTLLGLSTLSEEVKTAASSGANLKAAEILGKKVAEEAKKLNIEKVVFDRGGYLFHGRVRALAEAARKSGLIF